MIAQTDANVLIMGETGTGKELVADTIHHHSNYRNGPLVKVNLTALPETLVESELFGHEKGSFTGAMAQRKGRFEMAHKGTIFLDEIGDMTLSTAAQAAAGAPGQEFERVGGSTRGQGRLPGHRRHQPQPEGRGRGRALPRRPVLSAERGHASTCRRCASARTTSRCWSSTSWSSTATRRRSPPAASPRRRCRRSSNYDWPGNVRQLEHTIERAVIMARGGVITSQHLALDDDRGAELRRPQPEAPAGPESCRRFWPRSSGRCSRGRSTAPMGTGTPPRGCLA